MDNKASVLTIDMKFMYMILGVLIILAVLYGWDGDRVTPQVWSDGVTAKVTIEGSKHENNFRNNNLSDVDVVNDVSDIY